MKRKRKYVFFEEKPSCGKAFLLPCCTFGAFLVAYLV
jgi:hypothetical protein